jgi:1-acyl-sn-glycerol-3-phosphate acyltransferase
VQPKGSFRIHSGTIHVHLLEPVPTEGYDYEHRHALMRAVWERMADVLRTEYGVNSEGGAIAPAARQSA